MLCTIQAIVLGPVNNYVPVATLTPGHILEKCSEINIFQSKIFSNSFLHRFWLSSPTKSKTTHHYRLLWWSEFLFDIWCWFLTYFFAQARVSLKRIQEFLDREELDPNSVQKTRCKFTLSSLILGTLSKDDDDASENVGKKNEFVFFQT